MLGVSGSGGVAPLSTVGVKIEVVLAMTVGETFRDSVTTGVKTAVAVAMIVGPTCNCSAGANTDVVDAMTAGDTDTLNDTEGA